MDDKIVGVIAGSIGSDPFNRRSYSGISFHLFTALQKSGFLSRAFGADIGKATKAILAARNFNPDRRRWRRGFFLDPLYRQALTRAVAGQMTAEDFEHPILQIGAQFNVAKVAPAGARVFSYSDGNSAVTFRNPEIRAYTPEGRARQEFAYEKEVADGLEKVLTFTDWLRDSFIDDYGLPPDKVVKVGGGVNLEKIPAFNPDKTYDNQDILFLGVEFERKGGKVALEAFQAVRGRFPNATLHIAGPRELQLSADESAQVVYHGYLSRSVPEQWETLVRLFTTCTLSLSPSLYEPFGIAKFEGMLYQIPTIVSNGWGLKEGIIPGVTGDLVEPGSVDDLAGKLEHYLTNPDKLKQMGTAGRQYVLDHYTWDRVAEKIHAAIK